MTAGGDPWAVLIAEVAAGISRHYRIAPDAAAEVIAPLLRGDPALAEAVRRRGDAGEVRRLRVFKAAEKRARQQVYARLRQYKRADGGLAEATATLAALAPGARPDVAHDAIETILASHASTAERLDDREGFRQRLATWTGSARTVLDVGCGVMPLLFPFDACPDLKRYVALDRDPAAVAAVAAFARWSGRAALDAREWALADDWAGLDGPFDLAFMFKLVPVIARQESARLPTLAAAPAATLVLSGARTALARRRDIGHREARLLDRFAADHALTVVDRDRSADEVFLVVKG